MKLRKTNVSKKTKKSALSIVMYISASIVALLAVSLLINNIILFNNNVAMYVDQGYPSNVIVKQLIPSMLLPGIFEPIAVYGGIALILLAAGLINQNISKCLILLTKTEDCNDIAQDSMLVDNVTQTEEEAENNEDPSLLP
jgi:hypothetical protein